MKLTKGKKIALISFAAFLAFMAICTVVAKGIYASGLPRVSTAKPNSGSLTHVIRANATVMQGQEYGVYVEEGLRVDTVAVGNGDTFQEGQGLFRIETGDLEEVIAQRRLEVAKLEVEMAAAVKEDSSGRQSRKREADRAREDYDRKAVLADAHIRECQQAYDAAWKALALYDQYLADSAQAGNNDGNGESLTAGPEQTPEPGNTAGPEQTPEPGNTAGPEQTPEPGNTAGPEQTPEPGNTASPEWTTDPGITAEPGGEAASGEEPQSNPASVDAQSMDSADLGHPVPDREEDLSLHELCSQVLGRTDESVPGSDRGGSSLHELGSEGMDPEQYYNRQEKRLQLEQEVVKAAQVLEEAIRQKEDSLREAARILEDASAALDTAGSTVNTLALEIASRKEGLQKLEALLEADGWVYAEAAGLVVQCNLEVGSRIQDGAGIIYAMDDGERVLSAAFDEAQSRHISIGTQFDMEATMPDGSRVAGTALLDYLEKDAEGMVRGRFSFDLQGIAIGQTVELSYRMQTESYSTCISQNSVYKEGEDRYYVFLAEEREGILGTEWKVRKVNVRVLDQNDTMAAVQTAEINEDSRIVAVTDKLLQDGDTVRVLQ